MSADLSGGKRRTVPTFTLFLRQACLTGGFPFTTSLHFRGTDCAFYCITLTARPTTTVTLRTNAQYLLANITSPLNILFLLLQLYYC